MAGPKRKKRPSTGELAERRAAIIQETREAIIKYGQEGGTKLVMEKYPDISRSTWHRYLRELGATPLDRAADAARKAARNLPASPPPEYIAKHPGEARRNMDFLGRLEHLYSDAEMLRAYSMTKGADGADKIKIPTFFAQSIKLRSELLDNALKAMAQVWDLQRMQGFYELIMKEIGDADPETQKRILVRLQELNARVGMTMDTMA